MGLQGVIVTRVENFCPPPGGVCRPFGASFNRAPVRALTPLRHGMSEATQKEITALFKALWSRTSPKGCVWVFPLRGGDAGIGPLTNAVMGSVDQNAALSDVQWRTKIGDDVVKEVLTRFRHLADPLGNQKGVLLAGVCDPLRLGTPVAFANRPTSWLKRKEPQVAQDTAYDDLPPLEWVPDIPGGMEIHMDEKLLSDASRLMELWKGAVQTKDGEPGVTSLGVYDSWHDEIVILQAADGMRILGDMCGFHNIPHFVPGGLVGAGGGIEGCNFSWTLFWRFELDPSLREKCNASMMELLETVYTGEVACVGAAFGGGGGAAAQGGCAWGPGRDMGTLVANNKRRRGEKTKTLPWVCGTINTLGGGRQQLPELQLQTRANSDGKNTKFVSTSVHVERAKLSMGGHLTTTTLHPRFEALLQGVHKKARKPEFYMGFDQQDKPRIKLGGKFVSPIQDFTSDVKAMVWMLRHNKSQTWPLKTVDHLQTSMQSEDHSGRGFFTWREFKNKKHTTSDLHLVMQRDENQDTAAIWAVLPVEAAEIRVEMRNEADQELMTSESEQEASFTKKNPKQCNKAKKRKVNGGAPALIATAAAASMQKKTVEKRQMLDQQNTSSPSNDDAFQSPKFVAKKAPRQEEKRRPLEVEKQQQAVDEFKLQHEREKKEALAAFEAYKGKVKTREEQIKSECEDKVNKAAATLEQVKSEFKKRVDEFNAAVKKMEAAGGSQVEDLKKRHQKELADHVTARHTLTDQKNSCCACFSIYMFTYISCA